MAQDYRYFAANERTFLAWVRTGITVIALGFAMEKLEVLLRYTAAASADAQRSYSGSLLLGFGVLIIAAGWLRYRQVQCDLNDDTDRAYRSSLLVGLLAGGLMLAGLGLLIYLNW